MPKRMCRVANVRTLLTNSAPGIRQISRLTSPAEHNVERIANLFDVVLQGFEPALIVKPFPLKAIDFIEQHPFHSTSLGSTVGPIKGIMPREEFSRLTLQSVPWRITQYSIKSMLPR